MEATDDAKWFRKQLIEIGHTQASFARLMVELGDDRLIETIDRAIRRLANGSVRASGEMRALLGALRQQKQEN